MIEHVKAQNWLAVGLDFVIVVLGVTFALVAEQWISDRQNRADFTQAEAMLRRALADNYFAAKERIAVGDCIRRDIETLGDQLLEPEDAWTPPRALETALSPNAVYGSVLRSPSRSWGFSSWDSEQANGTFDRLGVDQRDVISEIFQLTDVINDMQTEIVDGQARLKVLGEVDRLNRSERLRYLDVLVEVDHYVAIAELVSTQVVRGIETLNIEPTDAEMAQLNLGVVFRNQRMRELYGDCTSPMTINIGSAQRESGE